MRILFVPLVPFVLSISAGAADYDQSPFGINGLKLMHAHKSPDIRETAKKPAKAMKDAGIYWDRLELWWHILEPEKGRFDWEFADNVVQAYREQGINAMVILCYTSAWSEGVPPRDADERARYANYVYQVVNRYKDTFKVWEIWNEPNIPSFWKEPNAEHYTLMLKEAYAAAKRADPTCTVLAASTSGPDLDFIKGIYRYGGWDYLDAISIHPYSMAGGPISQRLDKILRMHQEYMSSKLKVQSSKSSGSQTLNLEPGTLNPKPLWITEMGWTTHRPELNNPQAVYLIQSYVISLANGVEKLFWFDLSDWSEKWGIMRGIDPPDPKPAYEAYKMMTRHFGSPGKSASFEGYVRVAADVACYVFKRPDGKHILVLWSLDHESRAVHIPQMSGLMAEDILGETIDVKEGRFRVGPTPVFLTGVDVKNLGPVRKDLNPYLAQERRNLLNNGSFEIMHGENPGWWNAGRFESSAKEGTFGVSDNGRKNSKCVSISQSGERAAWDATPIPVEEGKKYRLVGWIKTENATGNNQIALFWYKGNQWTYQGEVRSANITGTNDWTRVEVTGEVPGNTTFVRVNLISENNTGTTWFDDLVLTEVR